MAREELVEGIRMAVKKGESLRDAMMSFYNAGYKKEDIEEAARIVYSEGNPQYETKQEKTEQPVEQKTLVENKPIKKEAETPSAPTTSQKVSEYSSDKKLKMSFARKVFLIILFIFLMIIGGLILILLIFKEKFMSILNIG